jgi:hypothetical protein
MSNFLTIREACEFTGKSESTIKRLIHSVTNEKDHENRSLISPTEDELKQKQKSGEPYIWKIDRSLLESRYPPDSNKSDGSKPDDSQVRSGGVADSDRLVTVLEKTIAVLEQELTEKNRQIDAFQERQREQNVLLRNLHDRMAIAAPAKSQPTDADAKAEHDTPEQGSHREKNPAHDKQSIWTRQISLFPWKR